MIRAIPNNKRRFLLQEICNWQEEKLITEDIASKLIACYPAQSSGNAIIGILMTIGAVLIGLGALLFVAANWTLLSAVCKVSLIIVAMCASYYSGWYFRFHPGKRPKLGSALLLLGALIYGAGIWLISQIFNMDLEISVGLLAWALGVVPLAFALNSIALAVLSAILIAAWNLSLHLVTANNFTEALMALKDFPWFAATWAFSCYMAYKMRSRTVLILATAFGAIWSLLHGHFLGELSYGVSLVSLSFLLEKKNQNMTPVWLIGGLVFSLLTLLAMTFNTTNGYEMYFSSGWLLWLFSFIAIFLVQMKNQKRMPECLLLAAASFSGLLTFIHPFGLFQALVSNAVLLVCLIFMMFAGAHRLKSAAMLNIAVVFLVLDIISRYFDIFFKTTDRSVFFVAGGFLLLITATLLENNRRKLLGDITK